MTTELSSEQTRELMQHVMKPDIQKYVNNTFAGKYTVSFFSIKGLDAILIAPAPQNENT